MVASFFSTLTSSTDLPRKTKDVVFDLYRLFAYTTIQAESYECEYPMLFTETLLTRPSPSMRRRIRQGSRRAP